MEPLISGRATRWLEGPGLHGGKAARARIRAVGDGEPLRVVRGSRSVDVTLEAARPVRGSTVLVDENGDPFAATVEHVLSALFAARSLTGVVIELEGDELPCLDGGSAEWLSAVTDAGLSNLGAHDIAIERAFETWVGDSRFLLVPSEAFRLEVSIDFAHPDIGLQEARWDGDLADYRENIAPARTFAMLDDATAMLDAGMARGIGPGSAIVFGPRGPLGTTLRFVDEPARHKLLDLAGDLALLGGWPRGLVRAHRPGHAATRTALARAIEAGAIRL